MITRAMSTSEMARPIFFAVLVQRGAGDEAGQDLPVEAHLARLVIGHGALGLTLQALQFILIFRPILLDADFLVANRRQLSGAKIVEDVANAEKAETDHDQTGENPQDDAAENIFRHDTQTVEHGYFLKFTPARNAQD